MKIAIDHPLQQQAEAALKLAGIGPAYSVRVLGDGTTETLIHFALIHDRGADYKLGPRRVYVDRKIPVDIFNSTQVLAQFFTQTLFVLHKI